MVTLSGFHKMGQGEDLRLNPVEYLGTAVRRAIDNPGTVTLPSDLAKELAVAQA